MNETPLSTFRDLGSAEGKEIDERDFLARVDLLHTLGFTVLISNHGRYFSLVEHLSRYTQRPIAFALGVSALRAIMTSWEAGVPPAAALAIKRGRLFGWKPS